MADKKKKKKNTKSAPSKSAGKVKTQPASSADRAVWPVALVALALFTAISYIATDKMGILGEWISAFFRGMGGGASFAIPVLCIVAAIRWRKCAREGKIAQLCLCLGFFYITLGILLHTWTKGTETFDLATLWNDGKILVGGGVFCGSLGMLFKSFLGIAGINIVGIIALILLGMASVGVTPAVAATAIVSAIRNAAERRREERENSGEDAYQKELAKQRKSVPVRENRTARYQEKKPRRRWFGSGTDNADVESGTEKRPKFNTDVDVGYDEDGEETAKPDDGNLVEILEKYRKKDRPAAVTETVSDDTDDDDLPPFEIPETQQTKRSVARKKPDLPVSSDSDDGDEQLISESEADMLNRFAKEQAAKESAKNGRMKGKAGVGYLKDEEDEPEAPAPKREYVFPPVSLLKYDLTPKNTDISEELTTNANKLVETLRTFKVETRLVDVSRGPAITRYELAPKEGVRVKQISNLVDDIALNLATTGVRVEAPIPGKAAVGVEVPNKTVSTVYLRELIDTETFRKASSRLTVGLGMDVAGDPVFLDIEKMPHLLIAGATGTGKSVCINSILTSLLYKSAPEDVKFILVDPKFVEFSIYSGLPHLLVPVVSDAKRAAGALQWAVTEMERRYSSVIGAANVRNISSYDAICASDPSRERLPRIVIVIDELADLMMTAPDDVENSICRLAQKGRAAGLHLILGTQRPSVNVVTGLIKANVPSKIAFRVASQTDSRVILDMAGAEKLIGRGDMLYAPMGSSKPRRVQGAFVESEIESIVEYIKSHNGDETEYDESVIESIERNAAACGNKKGAAGSAVQAEEDDGGSDPMLRQAIELAVESGKISTSLIQRRLSLGYGRAAKLIDEMESKGIVSGPDGQKPRSVLISRQQYLEMYVSRGEDL